MSVLINPTPPQLPSSTDVGSGLPVFGVTPQQIIGGVNHLVGWRGRRFHSTVVEVNMAEAAAGPPRENRHRRAGTSFADLYLPPIRTSPHSSYLAIEVEYVTTMKIEGVTDPAPQITLIMEKLDGTELDRISWAQSLGTLEPTPPVAGIRDNAGDVQATSPDPSRADTGPRVVSNPGVGDLTPRPLLLGAQAGQDVVLRFTLNHARVFAVFAWEYPEVTF